jgi:hypothetical protein
MSDVMPNGEARRYKTCRISLDMESVKRYEALSEDKPPLSYVISGLLTSWVLDQELKAEFSKLQ